VLAWVAWVAFKVGALSYGGGFVIIPLMQSDAVSHYHWMTSAQFLNAVALGQITPGFVVQTVAVVGYAAAGLAGGLLAALIAFTPSFAFILVGARHFDRIRADRKAIAFLDGAGPAAIGAIVGSAISLARALIRSSAAAAIASWRGWHPKGTAIMRRSAMTRPLGTRPAYQHTPLSAEEKARGEANFAPYVAETLLAKGRFRVTADTPEMVELFQHVARRVSDMLRRPVVSVANGRDIVITFGEDAPGLTGRRS